MADKDEMDLRQDNPGRAWYVIHTYSGYENKVKANLERLIHTANMENMIFNVVVPIEDEVEVKDGKKKVVQRKKFPCYVFIKMIYTNHIWFMVTRARGVTSFVGSAGRPIALTEDEIRRIGLETVTLEDFDIKLGDDVRIVNGALENFIGVVESISAERQKVKVIVAMFGRQTPVELDFAQVEKL